MIISLSFSIVMKLKFNNKSVKMEVDTGAALPIMSQNTQQDLFPTFSLDKSNVVLSIICSFYCRLDYSLKKVITFNFTQLNH